MPLIVLPGLMGLLVILGVVLLIFGPKKLPKLGGAIGESIRNFKKGIKDDDQDKKQLDEAKKLESLSDTSDPK
ncbi:hypothetical protein E3A20_12960 [Planctomyces bekefii]|uniref:Sec-independent protein translocase protein TatA n=1 Tax=Planctomyces bekefii TaxID=1653850 RepID=A0A5C6M5S9_9PLAN|nr:hypothetical protein E3A20_12960 [Planctomyces bekefii]